MKKLLIMALCCSSAAYAQQKDAFVLNGTVEGRSSGKVYIGRTENKQYVQDSVMMQNGKFTYKGASAGPAFYSVRLDGLRRGYAFFTDKGTLTLKADSVFNEVSLSGSAHQPVYREWAQKWTAISSKAGPLYQQLDAADKAKDTVARAAVRKAFDDLGRELDSAVFRFVRKHPASPVAPWIILDRYVNYPAPEKVDVLMPLLHPGALNSRYGKELKEVRSIAAKTGIGAKPDFALADTVGKMVRLSDYRGKYVLVDFWASWCGPCRKENPNVVAAYQKYQDQGFEVLGVTLDTKRDAWLAAIAKDDLTWTHVGDMKGWKSDIVAEYGIRAVPTNFLLDPSGKVIAKDLRKEALQQKLAELFAK